MLVSLHKVDKQANIKQTIAVDIHQTQLQNVFELYA
jgi:hypothetical protein